MLPLLIGISTGILTILLVGLLRIVNKRIMYGLILSGIGFLYVGYTWMDLNQLIINIIQAIVFVLFAYYGIIKSIYILVAGYFLHGLWDLGYTYFTASQSLPPHYDIFCLTVDFIIGAYILIFRKQFILSPRNESIRVT